MRGVLFGLCVLSAIAANLRVLLTSVDPPQVGVLNTSTGVFTLSPRPKFAPAAGCTGWNLGANGTRGQTSTVFDMNRSWFVLAQGTGCSGVSPVTLWQMMGPFGPGDQMNTYNRATVNTTSPLLNITTNWDWTCNVVVVTPELNGNELVFKTDQISEYDAQQRMQANYKVEAETCTTCWKKVGGLSGLDYGKSPDPFPPVGEWNCGDGCALYTLEEQYVDGKIVAPRALIGRSFRTGKLLYNITDSIQAQTMTYVHGRLSYLGIGRCCPAAWCDPACRSVPSGDLVLFEYTPASKSIAFRQHIGPETGSDPSSTVRLGVEVDSIYNEPREAFVLYNGRVVSFNLTTWVRSDVAVKGTEHAFGLWAQ